MAKATDSIECNSCGAVMDVTKAHDHVCKSENRPDVNDCLCRDEFYFDGVKYRLIKGADGKPAFEVAT